MVKQSLNLKSGAFVGSDVAKPDQLMLLSRFSHVKGCSQTALYRIMQRSAVCVFTWAICCRGKVKPFQSVKKQDFFPFPARWVSRDSWQDKYNKTREVMRL
ncbi:hypothetical protein AVEN_52226-1 [Araneus ventricosus]|uniref:Uncharacterized protein n=1 Tax=Araneus ventricosus TaxID=182803 RepID=A0A4Y2UCS5_ARAVE|nr:hypothetical protein AVEN_52226-1 [Araneus ventricosus]